MTATPTPVEALLATLPADRRTTIDATRAWVNAHMPPGYEETVSGRMIAWVVPLAREPHTYNGQPLMYAALAARKAGCSLYLMGAYLRPDLEQGLREAYARDGRRLDFGKSCLRFKRFEDVHAHAVATVIGAIALDHYIELHRAARRAG